MPNIIKPKRKYTTGAPVASQLAQGELAINLFDKKIYSKDLSNNIVLIGSLNGSPTEKFKVANAVADDEAISKAQMNEAIQVATPKGSIIAYPTQIVPLGYLECNGAAISRTTYANLFISVGTIYGTGDGSTTFNLPDFRGEFLRGWDHSRGIDSGRTIGSYQGDELRSHQHSLNSFGQMVPRSGVDAGNFWDGVAGVWTGATGGNETRPRNKAVMYCIKY